MTWDNLNTGSTLHQGKTPDVVFVYDGRFLDSLPAQMIAYRLSQWSPTRIAL